MIDNVVFILIMLYGIACYKAGEALARVIYILITGEEDDDNE